MQFSAGEGCSLHGFVKKENHLALVDKAGLNPDNRMHLEAELT
jgi:hypothetical protein